MGPVRYEPVSGRNSLITGSLQGIIGWKRRSRQIRRLIQQHLQGLSREIPAAGSRVFSSRSREVAGNSNDKQRSGELGQIAPP